MKNLFWKIRNSLNQTDQSRVSNSNLFIDDQCSKTVVSKVIPELQSNIFRREKHSYQLLDKSINESRKMKGRIQTINNGLASLEQKLLRLNNKFI